jgi:L-fucose isomerase-like protein
MHITAGFVGFGEVNTPRELIERKCSLARQALENLGMQLVATAPVCDDPRGENEARARRELSSAPFDLLVVCVAGWIPSHTVIDVVSPFAHLPVVLWGLAGEVINGRLVTTADQAGTSAIRDTFDALGYRYAYVYDTPDEPYAAAKKVYDCATAAAAAARLKTARVGMMGFRDMKLHATLVDGISLRRVVGCEIEVFETLEITQKMERVDPDAVARQVAKCQKDWHADKPIPAAVLEQPVRMYLAVMEKVRERGYEAISLIDVDGVKKLLHFTPAPVLMLLADEGGVASIPENDCLGAVTQLMVRYLTGQVGAYFEFYEFFKERVLVGVPDYVPSAVVDGLVSIRVARFGDISDGILNVSKVKTGKVTLCRLASRGDRYRMHIVTGQANTPGLWEEAGWEQPAPQLPSLEVTLDTPVEEFAQKVLGQHYILSYGDNHKTLASLCRLLGIEVI